jgi:probable phosphoglycerate mutase
MIQHASITRFGLMRHAQTRWNVQKRIQGQNDTRLTGTGRREAQAWSMQLAAHPWQRILASDLRRVGETVDPIRRRLNIPVKTDPRLREQDWGRWAGKVIKSLRAEAPQQIRELEAQGWDFQPPGGESRRSVLARSLAALEAAALDWPGQTVLVVAHEGVLKCVLYHLHRRQFLPSEPKLIKAKHLHWVRHDGNAFKVDMINALSLKPPLKVKG